MEAVHSKTLSLPLASLPEEEKFSYQICSTLPDSYSSPLKENSKCKSSTQQKLTKTASPKGKSDHVGVGATRRYRRNYTTVITTPPKQQAEVSPLIAKLHTELDKRFSVLDDKAMPATLKPIKSKKANMIMRLIEHSAAGEQEKLEQVLSSSSTTVQEKKALVNLEDQYGRSPLFYAVYRGNCGVEV
eukprot:TRINITY_DN3806_c0_g2_i5.p1 TRINITY_DN3806_c0_g2~~TRINITY_DN3806_c0_g2_i5.p1  ORF type:complete len:187 (-),score=39.21 TRINITY_DN3806_c0_g2_i5:901-1461(-)